MSTIEKLKATRLAVRKDPGKQHLGPFLALVISECENVGKDAGNRTTTEDEAIRVLKKIAKGIDESMQATDDLEKGDALFEELSYLEDLLPKMVSDQELNAFIVDNCNDLSIGDSMKVIRGQFGERVDMKKASGMVKTKLIG